MGIWARTRFARDRLRALVYGLNLKGQANLNLSSWYGINLNLAGSLSRPLRDACIGNERLGIGQFLWKLPYFFAIVYLFVSLFSSSPGIIPAEFLGTTFLFICLGSNTMFFIVSILR